jgi:hypothetical protein
MSTALLQSLARRELDRRVNAGFEVALFWDAGDDTTSVEVYHAATDEIISFRVPADQALDAFHHPFAHLALDDGEGDRP